MSIQKLILGLSILSNYSQIKISAGVGKICVLNLSNRPIASKDVKELKKLGWFEKPVGKWCAELETHVEEN